MRLPQSINPFPTGINRSLATSTALIVAAVIVVVLGVGTAAVWACGAVVRGARALAEETAEVAATAGGRALVPAGREAASMELSRGVAACGDGTLQAARAGGPELAAAATRYGPDVWSLGAAVPAGARALALRPESLVPLAKRVGPDVLTLEARMPTLAPAVAETFGDRAVHVFARAVPPQDAPRLLGFGRCARDPEARELLLRAYQDDPGILGRLDWKIVTATGLSVAMITAAYKVSGGVETGLQTVAAEHPGVFRDTIMSLASPVVVPFLILGIGAAVILLLRLWFRFRPPTHKQPD